MAFEDTSEEELLYLFEKFLRSRISSHRRFKKVSREETMWYVPREMMTLFVSGERKPAAKRTIEEDIGDRVSKLEKAMNKVVCSIDDINKQLKMKGSLKEEALRQFKEMVSQIPEVNQVYYLETTDGFDFWTLFESSNRIEALQKIVRVQVELDQTYKDVYFDFLINHFSDIDKSELKNWNLVYKRAPR